MNDVSAHKGTFYTSRYLSTSLDPHVAEQFGNEGWTRHMMKIHVPKGHPVSYTAPISENPKQREVLLPRNTLFKHTGKVDTHVYKTPYSYEKNSYPSCRGCSSR